MSKVYIVYDVTYYYEHVCGVYSTQENAQAYIDSNPDDKCFIVEFEMDSTNWGFPEDSE